MPKPYMDRFDSSLNPCSVETIPFPLTLADGRRVWPVAVSCYELQGTSRIGSISLFLIQVPDVAHDLTGTPLSFPEQPDLTIQTNAGILDGGWRILDERYLFATAHSSGEIQIHRVETISGCQRLIESDSPVRMSMICSSAISSRSNNISASLCLSVNWDYDSPKLVATFSDGRMAIYDYVQLDDDRASLVELDSWEAHTMFKAPSEVWSASFVDKDLLFSGGDDSALKVWDVRSTSRPVQTLHCFEAGVTCVSAHEAVDNLVAVGSCTLITIWSVSDLPCFDTPDDETIGLFDIRFMSDQKPLLRTKELGGGIWRMKWHPITPNRMLVAAMHGGCRVLNFGGGSFERTEGALTWSNSKDSSFAPSKVESFYNPERECIVKVGMKYKRSKEFTEHDSMAYGADWLVCHHPSRHGYFEAAVR